MSAYFLAEISKIKNTTMYREYVEKASSVVAKYGGKYIFKSEQLTPVSGNWDAKRIILIHFESKNKIQDCFQSTEYKEIMYLRTDATESKALIIEE